MQERPRDTYRTNIAVDSADTDQGLLHWHFVITLNNVSMRIGTRHLLDSFSAHVGAGERIGLVGRNGAGKTTLMRLMAAADMCGQALEHSGKISAQGSIGYLPQDTHAGDPDQTARDRVLSARAIASKLRNIRKAERDMSVYEGARQQKAMERYIRLDAEFTAAGGYAAESEAAKISAALGLPARVLDQPLGTLSGGQRRRVELARVLFTNADTLLLDEPTNHLDHDSIEWLREWLKAYSGGFIVISHSVQLLRDVVNRVWYFDANRAQIDQYAMGWDAYLRQRDVDEKRRKRERANAQKKAAALMEQANKMRYKATKAVAAQNMERRAKELLAGLEQERQDEKVAHIRFPEPYACGKTPLQAQGLSKSYGSLEVFRGVDLAIDRGSRVVVLGLNGAGKTTLLRILAGVEPPDTGEVIAGHGLRIGYYAQEHETIDIHASVEENMRAAAPNLDDTQVRSVLGSFLFSGDDDAKSAAVLSGGEKTRLALAMLVVSGANVLLLDEPTNNLDPASREEILHALRTYEGATVLVTHDEGAVQALDPERVLLLPEGDEDLWSPDYQDLISLA